MSDIDSEVGSKLVIAKWTDRFLAWLVDFIVILSVLAAINFAVTQTVFQGYDMAVEEAMSGVYLVVFFAYWTVLEYSGGQSVGKIMLKLKVLDIDGGRPSFKGVLLSSFGKTVLLPVDAILGLILTNEKRQRIFNKLGDTIVVKIKETGDMSDEKYVKD